MFVKRRLSIGFHRLCHARHLDRMHIISKFDVRVVLGRTLLSMGSTAANHRDSQHREHEQRERQQD
jgi:hypothetical protein